MRKHDESLVSHNTLLSCEKQNKQKEFLDIWKCKNRFSYLKRSEDQSSVELSSIEDSESELQFDTSSNVSEQWDQRVTDEMTNNMQTIDGARGGTDIKEMEEDIVTTTLLRMASEQQIFNSGDELETPQVMDVRTVIKLFKDLQIQIKTNSDKESGDLVKEVQQYKRKTEVMEGVIQRLGTLYVDLEKKTEQIELRSMRRAMVIIGLETEDRINKCIEQVKNFIIEELKLSEINVVYCFKLGVGKDKPVVFTVESIIQRASVYQAMETYRKQKEEAIFVNDYLPPEIKERRRREREIYKINDKDQANKVPMSISRAGLNVNGERYQPMISAPDPTDVLKLTEKQLTIIQRASVYQAMETYRKQKEEAIFVNDYLPPEIKERRRRE